MTMDVSRLGIVVESTGIKEASSALSGLGTAAANAEKKVNTLTGSLTKLLAVNTGGTAAAWAQSLGGLNAVLGQIVLQTNGVVAALNAATAGMNQVAGATARADRAHRDYGVGGNVVTNTLRAMTTAAVAYAAINLVKNIVEQADAWQMQSARLQNATHSMYNATVAHEQMFEMAQKLRVPLEDTIKLYTRLAPAVQRMGKDSGYAKDMVEGIATALQLGGATGGEAASVMLQLSQSFSSGVLNGAEFNAVAENGTVLMRALEKYTGKSTAELKKMGAAGTLTMKTVGEAIQVNLPQWREQFENLPVTFEGAMQRIKNAWTKAVGEVGEDTSFNKRISEGLKVIEDMLPGIAKEMGKIFLQITTYIDNNKEKLTETWEQIKKLVSDVGELAVGMGAFAVSIGVAGTETTTLSKFITLVRWGIAALTDGVKATGAMFIWVGAQVLWLVKVPIDMALKAIRAIVAAFADLTDVLAIGAHAVGLDTLGDKLDNATDSADKLAGKMKGSTDAVSKAATAAGKAAKDMVKDIADGNGALAKMALEAANAGKQMVTLNKYAGVNSKAGLRAFDNEKYGNPKVMDENAWGANPNPSVATKEDKGAAARARQAEAYAKALGEANAALVEQETLQKRMATYGLDYDKLGANQKKVIELEEKLTAVGTKWATKGEEENVRQQLATYKLAAAKEVVNQRTKEALEVDSQWLSKGQSVVASIEAEVVAMKNKVATYGMAKGAIEALELATANQQLAELQAIPETLRNDATNKRIEQMKQEVAARKELTDVTSQYGQLTISDEFDKLLDPKKAEKFGAAFSSAFGKIGKGFEGVVKALDNYDKRQAKSAKMKELIDKQSDPVKKSEMISKAYTQEAEDRLASYADMAGAAKGFFEEGSKGYKAMEAAERVFRLFQLGLQVKSFLQEMGFITTTTAAHVTGEAAKASASQAGALVQAEASMTAGTAAAAAGVANQAQGDPYSAWVRMAAMAAVMAALGFAVMGGGGGGPSVSESRQAKQGTGTVFGDEAAKSDSIAKGIEILSDNSDIALRYSAGMLDSLQSIEDSLKGVTNAILRTNGELTGAAFSSTSGGVPGFQDFLTGGLMSALDSMLGGIASKLLGFGSSQKLVDAGLTSGSQNVGGILNNGFDAQTYQDVETKKKAFFITYSDKTKRTTADAGEDLNNEFTNIIEGMVDTISNAGAALGLSADDVRARLEAMSVSLGDISLKDMSADDIQKTLEAVFSGIGDSMTQAGLGDIITRFQQAGEGLMETAVRVATGVEQANYELEKLGVAAVNFSDLADSNGDVGAEIVRQSLLVQEAGTGIGEIISTMSGTAGDIASTYAGLLSARTSLQQLGIADDVSRDLIRAAGGLQELQDALDSYSSNFFTDAEQNAMNFERLQKSFAGLNLEMPASKEAFRALVDSLSASGAEGQALATKVLLLSDSFANLSDAQDELVSTAREDLIDAYDRESQAIEDTKSKFEDFTKSLGDFGDSLLTGELSTADPLQQYQTQKARYEDVKSRAMGGDQDAIAEFQQVATDFLNSSRSIYASSDQYTVDFQRVLDETAALQDFTLGQVTVADQQLAALNTQVEGLITVNESVLTVTEAVNALQELLAGGLSIVTDADGKSTILPIVDGSHASGLSYVPHDGYIAELHQGEAVLTATENKAYQMDYGQYGSGSSVALVEEIRNLRKEVSELRAGQREQTGQLIAATFDAHEQSAQTVVEGQRDAASSSQYAQRAKATIV